MVKLKSLYVKKHSETLLNHKPSAFHHIYYKSRTFSIHPKHPTASTPVRRLFLCLFSPARVSAFPYTPSNQTIGLQPSLYLRGACPFFVLPVHDVVDAYMPPSGNNKLSRASIELTRASIPNNLLLRIFKGKEKVREGKGLTGS